MLPPILEKVRSLGFKVFDGPEAYDLNIIGIRSSNPRANMFDDLLCCAYREERGGPWVVRYWEATTDPGKYYLQNPLDSGGTAIIVEGQYRGAYGLGTHAGQYEALCQINGKIKVYRDANRDEVLDHDSESIQEGYFGCNIHKAGANSLNVDKWSAGCQVFAREEDFNELISLCKKQLQEHPSWTPAFTYTLIKE
ncbi:MAG: hypothetical protein NWE76_10840 [Candidatus Bathyarchaeota archaeon]|nr:hypothetical protein [Candidatus Bathyarchaeota archaeon]